MVLLGGITISEIYVVVDHLYRNLLLAFQRKKKKKKKGTSSPSQDDLPTCRPIFEAALGRRLQLAGDLLMRHRPLIVLVVV